MNKIEKAKFKFSNGCNCAQSVLIALADDILPEETLLLMASGFGGGILQQGITCGAVSGAIMALGLKKGYTPENKDERKAVLNQMGQDFLNRFEAENGATYCKHLIKFDISKPEEREQANEKNVFENLCPNFVASSTKIMDEIIKG